MKKKNKIRIDWTAWAEKPPFRHDMIAIITPGHCLIFWLMAIKKHNVPQLRRLRKKHITNRN